MGFKQSEVVPLQSANVSPTLPSAKVVICKMFQVARADTTATIKCKLPADATMVDFTIAGVASDAATTGVVSLGSSVTSTEFVPSADVKGGGTFIRPTNTGTNMDQLENIPLGANDIAIWAKYAETGTASTVGGPWKVVVYYVR